ncbi:MAG: succinylglutamate desuccinylase/aspartoacylase family protein [Clostridia bacterium]|nr:succinylglutamate desuccinylase/aspartoacylase family protein [Clostridia bacterium]
MAIVREITTVASVAMPVAESWRVKRCRYAAEGESAGRLCIATGIHGDEMMGQLVVFGVARRIMAQPEHLHGIVDIYPMLNPLGLDCGSRMVPSTAQLDMNRAFPGRPDGTSLESVCWSVLHDMAGADLVLDIHASTFSKSKLYEVRMNAANADTLLEKANALCPDLIWVLPDKNKYYGSLTETLCQMGTSALVIQMDERHRRPLDVAERVVGGIMCKLKEMGIWSGECELIAPDLKDIPCIRSEDDVCRVTCDLPGIYVPCDHLGKNVEQGELLGTIIDALEGEVREEVRAPFSGLIFAQRSYSAVYPGTLIARLLKREVKA